jgi:hypothetical protein
MALVVSSSLEVVHAECVMESKTVCLGWGESAPEASHEAAKGRTGMAGVPHQEWERRWRFARVCQRQPRAKTKCLQFDISLRCHQNVGVVRTQIQLPDELFARARKLCAAREISLAELARRGIEYTLSVYSPYANSEWQLPTPRSLGWRGLTDGELKAQAQMTSTESSLSSSHDID